MGELLSNIPPSFQILLFVFAGIAWLSWHISRERAKVQLELAQHHQQLKYLEELIGKMASSAELKEHIKIDDQDHRRLENQQQKLEGQFDKLVGRLDKLTDSLHSVHKSIAVITERLKPAGARTA